MLKNLTHEECEKFIISFFYKCVLSIALFFKVHEVNQKCCAEQSGLRLYIKIDWESHSEVLCVCEHFPSDSWPLFCNFSNLGGTIKEVVAMTIFTPHLWLIHKWRDVEVNVGAAVTHNARPLNRQDSLTALVLHQETGLTKAPLLLQRSDHLRIIILIIIISVMIIYLTRWRLDLQLLEAAGKAAGLASQGTHWTLQE